MKTTALVSLFALGSVSAFQGNAAAFTRSVTLQATADEIASLPGLGPETGNKVVSTRWWFMQKLSLNKTWHGFRSSHEQL
jgi:hypothetical protein